MLDKPVIKNEALLSVALDGLQRFPKTLPSKWSYDSQGSRHLEETTQRPKYDLSRTKRQILRAQAARLQGPFPLAVRSSSLEAARASKPVCSSKPLRTRNGMSRSMSRRLFAGRVASTSARPYRSVRAARCRGFHPFCCVAQRLVRRAMNGLLSRPDCRQSRSRSGYRVAFQHTSVGQRSPVHP